MVGSESRLRQPPTVPVAPQPERPRPDTPTERPAAPQTHTNRAENPQAKDPPTRVFGPQDADNPATPTRKSHQKSPPRCPAAPQQAAPFRRETRFRVEKGLPSRVLMAFSPLCVNLWGLSGLVPRAGHPHARENRHGGWWIRLRRREEGEREAGGRETTARERRRRLYSGAGVRLRSHQSPENNPPIALAFSRVHVR
jgi:hypothetical protein